jgi:hypothetical protein
MKNRNEKLSEIAQGFALDIIYAFGSHAKEALRWVSGCIPTFSVSSQSDLDIGVRPSCGKRLSINEKVHLAVALEELFSVSRVDVVVILEVDPFLAANIIRGERLYCKNEFDADEYDLYILRRAGDLIPLEREKISLIMERNT